MDRLFRVQGSWARALRFPDPAVVERNLAYNCPRYLDSWDLVDDDCPIVAEEEGLRCVPIGTIQHIGRWLDGLGAKDAAMTPLEVPSALEPFLGREYFWCRGSDIPAECLDGSKWFLKDVSLLKTWTSLLYGDGDLSYYIEPEHVYAVSGKMSFVSEWRCFVHEGEFLSCESYLGDAVAFPDSGTLRDMLAAYGEVPHPRAFTLDVGVTDGGKTVPLEVHPFAACGLYGFNGPEIADMYDAGWLWYLEEYVADDRQERFADAR